MWDCFFFGHHTVQALLDPAVLRSDSPLWRSSDSAASPRYCNLTSISVRFFVTCHYVTLLFVSDKNRFFFLLFFSPNLLGSSLLATTAAASTHIKTTQCQSKQTKTEGERGWERELVGSARTRLVLFSTTKTVCKYSPNPYTILLDTCVRMWMHEFCHPFPLNLFMGVYFFDF